MEWKHMNAIHGADQYRVMYVKGVGRVLSYDNNVSRDKNWA